MKNWTQDVASKLMLHIGISLWMAACYYPPQAFPQREPTLLLSIKLPFMPSWALVYQSVFLLHTAAIWCPRSVRLSWCYVRDVGLVFMIATPFFWLWPTQVERPATSDPFYQWLIVHVDGAGNAFPSLHAAIGLLGALHLSQCWPAWRPALMIWLSLLLVSTLLTHQHIPIDLAAGLALAFVIHRLSKTPAI